MKNILTGQIDYLNFKNKETVRSTQVIRATHNTVAKLSLSLSLYIYRERENLRYLNPLVYRHPYPLSSLDSVQILNLTPIAKSITTHRDDRLRAPSSIKTHYYISLLFISFLTGRATLLFLS
jgi:hypothetical protein